MKQPISADVTSYQCVRVALPNGAPDPAAFDNYYIRVKSHYELVVDSDEVSPDAKGVRRLHIPAFASLERDVFEQIGIRSEELDARFTEVHPVANRMHFDAPGKFVSWPMDQTISRGYRYLAFRVTNSIEKIETHANKKGRVTRTLKTHITGGITTIVPAGQIFNPTKDRIYWAEAKPEVRVDPVRYGYRD